MMHPPTIDLDVEFHLIEPLATELNKQTGRYRQAACWVAKNFDLRQLRVSVAIVDDETIQQVNRETMHHDWPTDVVSLVLEVRDGFVDGEIIASWETATRVCEKAGWSAADELLLYVVHGLLHLAGQNDVHSEQAMKMREFEQACLAAIGVAAAGEHVRRFEHISGESDE